MTEDMEDLINRIKKDHAVVSPRPAPVYQCEKCKDTGWIESVDEQGYEYMRHCECWTIRQAKELMARSGISREFQTKGFKTFDTKNNPQLVTAKNKAIKYYQSFKDIESTRFNSIMFCGQVGSGKTHLGTAICSNLMSQSVPVIYMAYRNAVTKIKQNIVDEAQYNSEIKRYSESRVLYIDDLLKGRLTETDINIMYEIVNHRYMNNLPIIVSTEKTPEQLLDFDEAIGSRMIEMCRGNIIKLQGKELNYRLYS